MLERPASPGPSVPLSLVIAMSDYLSEPQIEYLDKAREDRE